MLRNYIGLWLIIYTDSNFYYDSILTFLVPTSTHRAIGAKWGWDDNIARYIYFTTAFMFAHMDEAWRVRANNNAELPESRAEKKNVKRPRQSLAS